MGKSSFDLVLDERLKKMHEFYSGLQVRSQLHINYTLLLFCFRIVLVKNNYRKRFFWGDKKVGRNLDTW